MHCMQYYKHEYILSLPIKMNVTFIFQLSGKRTNILEKEKWCTCSFSFQLDHVQRSTHSTLQGYLCNLPMCMGEINSHRNKLQEKKNENQFCSNAKTKRWPCILMLSIKVI